MSGLRVVHVVCTDAFAGVERYVLDSARCLALAGCSVTVVGGAESSMREPLEQAGVRWLPGTSVLEAVRALRSLETPDVINTHMTLADLAGVLAARRNHVPVVSTRHFARARGSNIVSRVIARWIGRRLSAQIAVSEFVASNIESDSTIIYPGVRMIEPPSQPRGDVVLIAQRLEQEKSTDLALLAWSQLRHRGSWQLRVAGSGSQGDSLARLASALGISDSVQFVGFQHDLDEAFRSASVFFAPAHREPFGLSVIESMAYGLPVVAARSGGHLETAGGVAGATLFEPGDADDAARQLDRLMGDAERRRGYGLALQARQRQVFNLPDQTEATLRVYADVAR
jgi:glycosyltransferase involved in cell wall biosynthesis